jgi:hypothetical protein
VAVGLAWLREVIAAGRNGVEHGVVQRSNARAGFQGRVSEGTARLPGMPNESPFAELPDELPPGVLVEPDPDFLDQDEWTGRDFLWVSDELLDDAGELWARLFERRTETGLYPLLLDTLEGDPGRPWHDGELCPTPVGTIDLLTADGVLRRFWDQMAPEPEDDDDGGVEDEVDDLTSGPWPGLAASGESDRDPDAAARRLAVAYASGQSRLLGLVPATRGADTLTIAGWDGPCNHTNHTQEISAVVRSWEDRFGARVVAVGFDVLELSVAAPPETYDHALDVAAEHLAFCPDNIWQGAGTLEEYAKGLVGADRWSFWWD